VSKADHAVVADNVIGHGESGLAVAGSNDVTIVRNFVGADRSGGVQPNTLQGIYVQQFGAPSHPTGTVVGGSVADGNVVRNNPWEGIILENVDQTTVTGNVVQDNATTNGAASR
jgi:parallel beta-helix repeat protein